MGISQEGLLRVQVYHGRVRVPRFIVDAMRDCLHVIALRKFRKFAALTLSVSSMFSISLSRTLARSARPQLIRCFATETQLPQRRGELSEAEEKAQYEAFLKEKEKEGPLRPHLGVEVDPNHGLWGFFRKINKDSGEEYEVLEKDPYGSSGTSARHTVCVYH